MYNHPLAEGLLRVYRLDCGCDEAELKDTLERSYGEQIDHIEFNYTKTPTYTPDDYSLGNVSAQGLHLDLIKAKQAWDITKGSAEIKVAVMENYGFQTNHPDLASNIAYQHGNVGYLSQYPEHGTFVAGCIAATTDNNLGVSSIGILDTAYLEEIEDLYETTTSNRVWVFTRSLLVDNSFIDYSEPVYFIEDIGPRKRGQFQNYEQEEESNLKFEIYPNPTSNYLVIDYWITNRKNIRPTLTITNSFGQLLEPVQLGSSFGRDIVHIDLPSGVYYVSLSYGNELNLTRQFVVMK